MRRSLAFVVAAGACGLLAADPTFLRRHIAEVQPKPSDLTTPTARYRPVFGAGDADARSLRGIARFGELTVDPGGQSELVSYPAEEQIYYVVEGSGAVLYGGDKHPLKPHDFLYLPVGVRHGVANESAKPVRVLVMGFRIPAGVRAPSPSGLQIANAADAKGVMLGESHGPTVLYQLLMGTTESKRDVLASASQMVSLFLMDFAPGGTNIPHHHDDAEEIYYVLQGHGDMVAGGGADGNEGRYPVKEGHAYFFRLNTTVGFYSATKEGEPHARILAVRSRYPFRQRRGE